VTVSGRRPAERFVGGVLCFVNHRQFVRSLAAQVSRVGPRRVNVGSPVGDVVHTTWHNKVEEPAGAAGAARGRKTEGGGGGGA